MHPLDILLQAAIPIATAIGGLVLVAYHFSLLRDGLRQLTRLIESILHELAGALDRTAASVRRVLVSSTQLLTRDGQFPLPLLIVAVTVLTPVLVLIVVVEVRLWAGYFEGLFPEEIQVPIVGVVSAGVLTALMPVAAGFLLGWLVEAMLGAFPLPILGGAVGPGGSPRVRGLLAVGLVVLWALLAVTVLDAANAVYDGLGESTCALRAAGAAGPAAPVVDPNAGSAAAVPSVQPQSEAAQVACVADWKADDQARSIRVVLGELALHLSALFAWSALAGVGLLMLLVLCVPVVGLALIASFTRLCARLAFAIAALVEMLLGLVHAVGVLVVRLLRWAGLPLPPTEGLVRPAISDAAAQTSMAPVQSSGLQSADGASVRVLHGANGTGYLPLS